MIGIIRYTLMRFQENKDFTLKGRTAQSISRDSIDFYKRWLERTNRQFNQNNLHYIMCSIPYTVLMKELDVWSLMPIQNFQYQYEQERYEIRQINSILEIEAEGRVMKHCVASYSRKCKEGKCSIWTFSKYNSENRRRRILTIEVVEKSIVQAKGTHNSNNINIRDYEILHEWLKKANLSIDNQRVHLKIS